MANSESENLKALELRLLRSSILPAKTATDPSKTLHDRSSKLISSIEDIVSSIEKGEYAAALSSDAVRGVFPFAASWEFEDSAECADRFYCEVEKSVRVFLRQDDSEAWLSVLAPEDHPGRSGRALLVLCIGLAAFLAFTQCNMTGPVGEFPPFPLPFTGSEEYKTAAGSGEWEMWARKQLMSSGSDLLGKFSHLQLFCKVGHKQFIIYYWGTILYDGEALAIMSMAYLEAGLVEHAYGCVDLSGVPLGLRLHLATKAEILIDTLFLRIYFNHAKETSGLHLSLTGALGFRTVHQAEAKAQMVLVTNAAKEKSSKKCVDGSPALQGCSTSFGTDKTVTLSAKEHENCDILMTPKLVEIEKDAGMDANAVQNGGSANMTLDAIQQAVILAQCLFIKKNNPDDELRGWQMAPFIEAVDRKKSAAVDLIKLRLRNIPNDPRLWCSLGDVTNDDAYYNTALEVSNNRSARAKPCSRESAMALNSLYPDGWFALGAAALKDRDIDKALDGFTRAVQLDPENGEAWNNVACIHMMKKRSKEAFIAFKEALKFRIDAEVLERLMLEMESRSTRPYMSSPDVRGENCAIEPSPSNSCGNSVDGVPPESSMGMSRETEHLMDLLGKVLQQIVRTAGGGDMWGLYARWYRIKGDLTMCSEALLKQVRAYQGSDLWDNEDRFKKFARASLDLCKVYLEIASSTGSHRELAAAEMHLKNTIKQRTWSAYLCGAIICQLTENDEESLGAIRSDVYVSNF
ncbi:hypothetical protein ACLOJK_033573 [Asimina triloba]